MKNLLKLEWVQIKNLICTFYIVTPIIFIPKNIDKNLLKNNSAIKHTVELPNINFNKRTNNLFISRHYFYKWNPQGIVILSLKRNTNG